MKKPILVFGYGNLSRGDDAVGPLLLEYLEQQADLTQIELQTDFQLQIEHALDLQDRELVIFADASVAEQHPFGFSRIEPCQDNSYTSHAMSPAALLQVFQTVTGQTPPPSYLLSIKAESFELGETITENTSTNLNRACLFIRKLLSQPVPDMLSRLEHINHIPFDDYG
ncbi:MAG: hydrogenase maturation protease [Gammaproteobacteria bacterium]